MKWLRIRVGHWIHCSNILSGNVTWLKYDTGQWMTQEFILRGLNVMSWLEKGVHPSAVAPSSNNTVFSTSTIWPLTPWNCSTLPGWYIASHIQNHYQEWIKMFFFFFFFFLVLELWKGATTLFNFKFYWYTLLSGHLLKHGHLIRPLHGFAIWICAHYGAYTVRRSLKCVPINFSVFHTGSTDVLKQ